MSEEAEALKRKRIDRLLTASGLAAVVLRRGRPIRTEDGKLIHDPLVEELIEAIADMEGYS